jgi:hypothetical protein
MLVTKITQEGSSPFVHKEIEYNPNKVLNKKAKQKDAICNMISEGSQLTLLATIIEQIGEKVGLDTPEYNEEFKPILEDIRLILTLN